MGKLKISLNSRELRMLVHALVDLEIEEAPDFKKFSYEEIDSLRKRLCEWVRIVRASEKSSGGRR